MFVGTIGHRGVRSYLMVRVPFAVLKPVRRDRMAGLVVGVPSVPGYLRRHQRFQVLPLRMAGASSARSPDLASRRA
jgi:hypothetical protein